MKFAHLRVSRHLPAGGVLWILASTFLAAGSMIVVLLSVASSEAAGPPPDLGSDFNLPSFFLEQGRPAPVFAPRSPQSLPTPTPTPTATPTPSTESPCENGVVVPANISNPGLLADCELLWAMKQGFTNADEKLNWNAETSILEWDGLHCTSVRARVVTLDLGRYASLTTGLTISYDLTGTLKMPADLVEAGGLEELYELNLTHNHLQGAIPTQLGQLDKLVELSLHGNDFTGSIPTSLGNLDELVDLDLGHNQLTGSIPTSLGNLDDLEELHLSYNRLSGSIPASLGKLLKLEQLDLMDNRLTGAIPSQLGRLKKLFWLTLSFNRLSGSIPASLTDLSELERLWLEGGRFSGCIPPALQSVENHDLHSLDINFCVAPGEQAKADDRAVLVELYNSLGGEDWRYQRDWLSNKPLEEWYGIDTGDEGRVIYVYLAGNGMKGSIPASLGNLSNLEYLDFSNNFGLTGSIPASLGNLSNLEEVHLWNTGLTGSIPASLGNLSRLEYMSFNTSDLTGSIPSSLGNLSNLVELDLTANELTGSIPASLGKLSKLKRLWLRGNELTSIPSELGNLDNLESVSLRYNPFEDDSCIPDGLRDVAYHDLDTLQLNYCGGGRPGPPEEGKPWEWGY